MSDPELHPLCVPLAPLLGTWRGRGDGRYPTIEPFAYLEELTFGHVGKPFLAMMQKTRDASTNEPRHTEAGYLRPQPDGTVELVVAQPSGVLESLVGSFDGTDDGLDLALASIDVGLSPTAKSVTATERRLTVVGDVLVSDLSMAAMGEPMTHHLRSELHRA